MIESLFDSPIKEKILLSIYIKTEAYPREIAALFKLHLLSVQNQFKKLENSGVLASKLQGRTRLYAINPRYPFINELNKLLEKAFSFMSEKEKKEYYTPRLRPRRTGKPLSSSHGRQKAENKQKRHRTLGKK